MWEPLTLGKSRIGLLLVALLRLGKVAVLYMVGEGWILSQVLQLHITIFCMYRVPSTYPWILYLWFQLTTDVGIPLYPHVPFGSEVSCLLIPTESACVPLRPLQGSEWPFWPKSHFWFFHNTRSDVLIPLKGIRRDWEATEDGWFSQYL